MRFSWHFQLKRCYWVKVTLEQHSSILSVACPPSWRTTWTRNLWASIDRWCDEKNIIYFLYFFNITYTISPWDTCKYEETWETNSLHFITVQLPCTEQHETLLNWGQQCKQNATLLLSLQNKCFILSGGSHPLPKLSLFHWGIPQDGLLDLVTSGLLDLPFSILFCHSWDV